jgi:hypothetical protein
MYPGNAKELYATFFEKIIMGPTRFERVTSRLSAVRSTWLSYGPGPHVALIIPLITVSLLPQKELWALAMISTKWQSCI